MNAIRITAFSLALALSAFAAPVYKVTINEDAVVGGSAIKAGDYRIEVNGDKATLKAGKTSIEVPVKIENSNEKFQYTSVECVTNGGKTVLEDIRVGGTSTKLVFTK